MLGHRIWGKRLGIIGMGRIGQAVARRARAFGLQIHYHNRRRVTPEIEGPAMDLWGPDNAAKVEAVVGTLAKTDWQPDVDFNGNVGALPPVCMSEPDIAFLIRTASGRWIANGTVLR